MTDFTIQDVHEYLVSYRGLSYPEDAVQTFWDDLNREVSADWTSVLSEEIRASLRTALGDHVELEPAVRLESPMGSIKVEEIVRNTEEGDIAWLEKFIARVRIGDRLFSCSVTRDELGIERVEDIEEIEVLQHIEAQWVPVPGMDAARAEEELQFASQDGVNLSMDRAAQNLFWLMLRRNSDLSDKLNLTYFLSEFEETGGHLMLPNGVGVHRTQNFLEAPSEDRIRLVVDYGMRHFFEINVPVDSYEGRDIDGITLTPVELQDVVVIIYRPVSERIALPGPRWWRRAGS